MKKVIGIILLLLFVNVTTVLACSPVIFWDTTIIIVDGDEFNNSPEYNYDLLFNKSDYPDYYQSSVNNQFILDYPNYESFTFLEDGEWVSYKAHYAEAVDIWESGWNHEFHPMRYNDIQEYKIIVFDNDGNVIAVSQIYNKEDYGYYDTADSFGSIAHTFDEGTETFGQEAIGNGCENWGKTMLISVLFGYAIYGIIAVAISVFIIKLLKKRRGYYE